MNRRRIAFTVARLPERAYYAVLAWRIDRIRIATRAGRMTRHEAIKKILAAGGFTPYGAADMLDHRMSAAARYKSAFAHAEHFALLMRSAAYGSR